MVGWKGGAWVGMHEIGKKFRVPWTTYRELPW